MIKISHRGNLKGKEEAYENNPEYIDSALAQGYDVEIDLWYTENNYWLGHDEPQYQVSLTWLESRKNKLWVHCKNIEALVQLREAESELNYFWHESDTVTLTSKGFIWAYPGKQPIKNSIGVMPELLNDNIQECLGICSDYIANFE